LAKRVFLDFEVPDLVAKSANLVGCFCEIGGIGVLGVKWLIFEVGNVP
jgi:hypothetical protein